MDNRWIEKFAMQGMLNGGGGVARAELAAGGRAHTEQEMADFAGGR